MGDWQMLSQAVQRLKSDIKNCRVALVILAVYLVATQLIFHNSCPFAICVGFACPGCGLTRAALALFCGNFTKAWQSNPTIFLWVPLIIAFVITRYFYARKMSRLLILAGITGVITMGVYVYRLVEGNLVEVPCKGILVLVQRMI